MGKEQKKVLVIEDDDVMRESLTIALKDAGFDVTTAENGKKGEKEIRKQKADLVLLDLIMPEKNGYDVLASLKEDEKLELPPIVVLTVLKGETSYDECIKNGACDYVVKSENSLEEIIEKVKKYIK